MILYFASYLFPPSVVHLSIVELAISTPVTKVTFQDHHKNLKGTCDAYDYHIYLKIPSVHTNTTQKV